VPHPLLSPVLKRLDDFVADWAAVWVQYEADDGGWPDYLRLLDALKADLGSSGGAAIPLKNGLRFFLVLDHMVLLNLFEDADAVTTKVTAVTGVRQKLAS
jgi:hypothetical protein